MLVNDKKNVIIPTLHRPEIKDLDERLQFIRRCRPKVFNPTDILNIFHDQNACLRQELGIRGHTDLHALQRVRTIIHNHIKLHALPPANRGGRICIDLRLQVDPGVPVQKRWGWAERSNINSVDRCISEVVRPQSNAASIVNADFHDTRGGGPKAAEQGLIGINVRMDRVLVGEGVIDNGLHVVDSTLKISMYLTTCPYLHRHTRWMPLVLLECISPSPNLRMNISEQ